MLVEDLDLAAFVGREAEPPRVSRYAVNEAMIRNWVEAHEDFNPIYVDAAQAKEAGRSDVICPPAMVSTWVMKGYRRSREVQAARAEGVVEDTAFSELMALLDERGFTSVVGTNVDQTYLRELVPGDRITCHQNISAVSELKQTGLGEGHFVTVTKRYLDQSHEVVAEESFRVLRFRPRKESTS